MPQIKNILPPRVIDFTDYHQLIREFYLYKKKSHKNFSFRRFAQLAGIKSSNYLMLVMDRKRKLSQVTARRVAKAMSLTKPETEYFLALVKEEQARSPNEVEQIENEKRTARKKVLTKDLPADKTEYLRTWYCSLVRELAFLPDFECEPIWIAKKLKGVVTEAQAESAIKVLINLGLWTLKNGSIQVNDVFLDTGPEDRLYQDVAVSDIHKQNLLAWTKIIDAVPKCERELGLIHIPINADKLPEFKARIQRFQDEIIGWLQDEQTPTQVVQLGTYLIPVTTPFSQR